MHLHILAYISLALKFVVQLLAQLLYASFYPHHLTLA